MKFDLNFAGFVLSLVVAASGWFFRWSDKQKFEKQQGAFERQQATQEAVRLAEKALNEERDFNHLKNNQKDISNGVALGFNEMDRRFDDVDRELLEIKAWLIRSNGE
ncbi:hypothetical protein [uncultured Nostoc sp.]|uniref:hypothetical protein n=1 Tax=uncultured Nostoc sp. TaxID=340711 RepID=UPI0035CB0683